MTSKEAFLEKGYTHQYKPECRLRYISPVNAIKE